MNKITSYMKVSESKGNKRIWLESKRLERNGFRPGEAYTSTLNLDDHTLTLEINLFGDKRVSSRKRKLKNGVSINPILDICNTEVTNFVGENERVKVEYFYEKIVVSLHHEEVAKTEREARLKQRLEAGKIDTGTLCAGAGISTAAIHDGLLKAGLKSQCNWLVDTDSRYLEIADRNNHAINEQTHFYVGSVEELEANKLKKVDLLNVSLPCNIHSSAGKAKKQLKHAEEHESITALVGLINVVKCVNPSIIVSENVIEAQSSTAYMLLKAELNRLGYNLSEAVLDETHGGAIETRRRYWFVAVSSGLSFVDLSQFSIPDKQYKSVADIVIDDEFTPEFKEYEYLAQKEIRDIAAGKGFRQNLVDLTSETVGTIGKGYAKVRGTEPRLKGYNGLSRLFSVEESCKLRLIPEHLLGDCGFTIGHEAAGQSILYQHGMGIGSLIGNVISN